MPSAMAANVSSPVSAIITKFKHLRNKLLKNYNIPPTSPATFPSCGRTNVLRTVIPNPSAPNKIQYHDMLSKGAHGHLGHAHHHDDHHHDAHHHGIPFDDDMVMSNGNNSNNTVMVNESPSSNLVSKLLMALHTGEPMVDEKLIDEWVTSGKSGKKSAEENDDNTSSLLMAAFERGRQVMNEEGENFDRLKIVPSTVLINVPQENKPLLNIPGLFNRKRDLWVLEENGYIQEQLIYDSQNGIQVHIVRHQHQSQDYDGHDNNDNNDNDENNILMVAKVVELLCFTPLEASQALLESELMKRLDHPNVVQYYRSIVSETSLIIIMEYCAGGNLRDYLLECDEFIEEARVRRWIVQLASGLQHIHERDILHRDIKTENILLTEDCETIKIADLGIAKEKPSQHNLEQTRNVEQRKDVKDSNGTPLYMAPELCIHEPSTEKADCWALGCVIYEICHKGGVAFPSQERGRRSPSGGSSVVAAANFLSKRTCKGSDVSISSYQMLLNIQHDLKRFKNSLTILPAFYSQTMNNLTLSLLSPNPEDRPSLEELISQCALTHADLQTGGKQGGSPNIDVQRFETNFTLS